MKYIISEIQHKLLLESSSTDNVLKKLIEKEVLNNEKYFWISKIHSIETNEREDGLDARILMELNPKYKEHFPRLRIGEYSKNDGGWLYYGMEIENSKKGIRPYDLSHEVRELASLTGLEPHSSLFNVYYIFVGKRTPERYYP